MRTFDFKTIVCVIICAFMSSSVCKAQALMATLQHGDETKVYYDGAESLGSALNDAVTDDIITLSIGTFNAKNITKAVKIYGANGWGDDITRINGDFTISIEDGDATSLHIEGLHVPGTINFSGELKGFIVKRCKVDGLVNMQSAHSINCLFSQCTIKNFDPDDNSEGLYLKNCYISNLYGNSETATLYIENCCVDNAESYNPTVIATNSIFYRVSKASTCFYTNCIYSSYSYINSNAVQKGCWKVDYRNPTWPNLFQSDGILTDENAAIYVGTDGTPVGLNGGTDSWVTIPAIPQIVESEVAPKTTADGKLSVKFTVKTQQ